MMEISNELANAVIELAVDYDIHRDSTESFEKIINAIDVTNLRFLLALKTISEKLHAMNICIIKRRDEQRAIRAKKKRNSAVRPDAGDRAMNGAAQDRR